MPIAAFLMALIGPLARQLLVSIGIGLVTFVGLDAAVGAAFSAAKGSLLRCWRSRDFSRR